MKVALLLFLLFFASAVAFTLANTFTTLVQFKRTTLTVGFNIFQPNGGDDIDNPIAPT